MIALWTVIATIWAIIATFWAGFAAFLSDSQEMLLGAVISAVIGAFFAIVFEVAKTPKLQLVSENSGKAKEAKTGIWKQEKGAYPKLIYVPVVYLKLRVNNISNPKFLLGLQRHTAEHCRGTATFYSLEDQKLIFSEELRWSASPEPIMPVITNIRGEADFVIMDEARYINNPALDIGVNDKNTTLAILAKFSDDGICYGWSPESYKNNKKDEKRKLSYKDSYVEVKITSAGADITGLYHVTNGIAWNDLTLVEALPQEKNLVKALQCAISKKASSESVEGVQA